MKKILAMVAVLLMSINLPIVSGADNHIDPEPRADTGSGPTIRFAGGDGTVADPYQISNVDELQSMNQSLDAHYILVNDIDASATSGWNGGEGFEPIARDTSTSYGFQGTEFTGSLDGQGHTITGLYINRSSTDYVGLFGWVDTGGSVSNISLTGINVEGNFYVGGLVGESGDWASSACTITNCYATGSVSGDDYVGGLVGDNYGDITNCYATGSVSGDDDVGGLVGYNYGDITNCYATGNVNGTWVYVGGLVGRNEYGDISNCYATGSVSGDDYVGGLVGYNSYSDISNCYATGSIYGDENIGGLVGSNIGSIVNSHYNFDSVLINGENIITPGALYANRFNTWLSNGRYLEVDDYLSKSGSDYLINDVIDFKELLAFGQNSSLSFKMTSDMDLSGEADFYIPYLSGHFNGDGHTINGLNINMSIVSCLGLFGYIDTGGSVSNIGLTGNYVEGDEYIGGLVGYNRGDMTNCHATGSVSGDDDVGGLVGYNSYGDITNCYATGSVSGDDDVGGLVGYNYGDITNCYATGNVSGTGHFVGGLVGWNRGDISNCYATGSVSGYRYVGGLVGENDDGDISNCYATGSIYGDGSIGGLVGSNMGSIVNSHYNFDSVLINGENIITPGALYANRFNTWLSNGRYLEVDDYLSKSGSDYLINDVIDFKELLAFGQNSSLSFKMTSDIDLSGEADFYIPYLSGHFNGDGHTINGLNINMSIVSCLGLFGYIDTGGSVSNTSLTGIDVEGYRYVGGMVGYNRGDMTNCHATGSVSGDDYVGGLVGYNSYGDISNCYATGSVSGDDYVGGLVGYNNYGDITDCYATGNVNGTWDYVGGLVGRNYYGDISNCYATGSVSGTDDNVGGLVGRNYYGDISNCYATGSVSGDDYVGGLVGYNYRGEITNCYATGCVVGYSYVGGFVGRNNSGSMSGNFWDTQTSGTTSGVGYGSESGTTGKTTAEMMSRSTFTSAGWDFDTIWDIHEGVTYPFFRVEAVKGIIGVNLSHAIEDQAFVRQMSLSNDVMPGVWSLSTENIWFGINTNSGIISGTPNDSQVGDWDATVYFSETGGDTYEKSITITVLNTPPIITTTDPPGTVDAGELYQYDFNSDDDAWGNVTWTLDTDADWLGIDPATGIVNGTPSRSDAGYFSVNVKVDDGNGGVKWFNYMLEVVFIELIIVTEPATDAMEESPYEYDVNINEGYEIVNPTGLLDFSLDVSPDNMTIDSETGLITWTPTNNQAEQYHSVTVRVKDGAVQVTQQFSVHVENVNDDPEIVDRDPSVTAAEGDAYSYQFSATDEDPTGDVMTWDMDTNATWLEIDADGLVSGIAEPGVFFVNVTVSDGNGGSDSFDYILSVEPAPPVYPDISTPVLSGVNVTVSVNHYDIEWDVLSGAAAYRVQESSDDSFSDPTFSEVTKNSSISFSGKENGTYYYRVRGESGDVVGPWSAACWVTVELPAGHAPGDENGTGNNGENGETDGNGTGINNDTGDGNVTGDDDETITVTLGPFKDDDGKPVSNAQVSITINDTDYTGITDEDGLLVLEISPDDQGEEGSVIITTSDGVLSFNMDIEDGGEPPEDRNADGFSSDDQSNGNAIWMLLVLIIVIIMILAVIAVIMRNRRQTAISEEEDDPFDELDEQDEDMQYDDMHESEDDPDEDEEPDDLDNIIDEDFSDLEGDDELYV